MPDEQTLDKFTPLLTSGDISNKTALYFILSNLQGTPATQGMTWSELETALTPQGIESVDTIAQLRALPGGDDIVFVKGHTSAFDGGEGIFRLLGTGANPADIDSSGDDDNGWHIVTTGAPNAIYGRQDTTVRPEHFGAVPYATDAAAAAGSDQHATVQRAIDLWVEPSAFSGGWAYRTSNVPTSLQFEASTGYWRNESTLLVDLDSGLTAGKGYFDRYVPGDFRWYGWAWVPYATEITCFELRAFRNSGAPRLHFKAFKQRNTVDQSCWFTTQDWPKIARDFSRYRTWAATTTYYRHERITHQHADGSIYLYVIETAANGSWSGATASTAPTHTSGTVTDGTVDLKCIGQVRTSTAAGAETWDTKIRKSRDWGVLITSAWEKRDIHWEADGFTVGLACVPRTNSAVGWSHFKCHQCHCCMHSQLLVEYGVERRVANTTERDAIAGQPVGYRALTHDTGNVYSWNGSTWDLDTHDASSAGWVNDNVFELGMSTPRPASSVANVPAGHSVYGTVIDRWEFNNVGPNNNTIHAQALEKVNNDATVAEVVQALFARCEANVLECRDDTPDIHGRLMVAFDTDDNLGTNDPTRYPAGWKDRPADRNKIIVDRAGVLYAPTNRAYRTSWNNNRWNIVAERPGDIAESPVSILDVPSISRSGVFSGGEKLYSTKLVSWYFGDATPLDYLKLSDNYGDALDQTRYHAGSDSFDLSIQYPACFLIDLPDNFEGLARILVDILTADPTHSSASELDGIKNRYYVRLLDVNNAPIESVSSVFLHEPVWPCNIETTEGTHVRWQNSTSNFKRTLAMVPSPFVRRIVVGIAGPRIHGLSVKVYGDHNARVLPVHFDSQLSNEPHVTQAPEKGIYTGPTKARQVADPSKSYQLNESGTTTKYHATSGSTTAITPTASSPNYWLHDGASQGSAEIFEWDGTALQSIAINAYYTEPEDWLIKGEGFEPPLGQGNLGATPTIDLSQSGHVTGVINANITSITLTDPPEAKPVRLVLKNLGGFTVPDSAWSGVPLQTGGRFPVIDTGTNAVTTIELYWDGTNYTLPANWA